MNRYFHIVLITVSAFLMVILLILGAGSLTPAYSAGATIKVPDDYGTIQAAVDAAGDGDTIMVAAGMYNENLSITEGITLSGGWNVSFTLRTPGQSHIDGQGLGRVISITCTTSDTVVTVDGFTILNGDASGLGAPAMPASTADLSLSNAAKLEAGSDSPSERAASLRGRLADMAERGLYPGGSAAYQAALARLEELTTQAEEVQSKSKGVNAPAVSSDAGGGIYSWNASLHLLNSTIEWNTASQMNYGYGGGVFVGQAAPHSTVIADNAIQYNTASVGAYGAGGGLHLYHAPGALIEGNEFRDNVGSQAGEVGSGGGMYVDDSQFVWVDGNLLARNTAHAGWECPPMYGGGVGGGAQFRSTDSLTITNNIFRSNLGALHCGSSGGGLHVYTAKDVNISDNQVVDNWGVLFKVYTVDKGGGIGLSKINGIRISGNEVRGNTTSMSSLHVGIQVSQGGGLHGSVLIDTEIISNTFSGNVAGVERVGYGGGIYLEESEKDLISDNTIFDNTASLLGEGAGGGMNLRNTIGAQVLHNRFEANRGSAESTGHGGGFNIESYGPYSIDTKFARNLFLENQGSGYPGGGFSYGGAGEVVTYGFEFTNNVVAGNTAKKGAGLKIDLLGEAESGEVTNNTFVGNDGTGVLVGMGTESKLTFNNNIVVDHTVGISVTEGTTATIHYTLWNGNGTDISGGGIISQTHAVSGDPAFVDPAGNDYHLTGASAAVDTGDPAGVPPAPSEDLDGVERPQFAKVDIGAYEWGGEGHIYLPFVTSGYKPYIGWAAGDSVDGFGTILFTQDGGENWNRQGSSASISDSGLSGVHAVDACSTWVVGANVDGYGVILHTTDGGENWTRQGDATQIPDVGLNGVYAVNKQTAWVSGQNGVILYTNDGGETWKRQAEATAPPVPLRGVYASDADHVWVVGDPSSGCGATTCGVIMHTKDGGGTWERQVYTPAPSVNKALIWVHGIDENTLWVVGNGTVLKTNDGGETWGDITSDTGGGGFFDYNGVFAVDEETVWISQDDDGIYNYDGTAWHEQTTPLVPRGYYFLRISAVDVNTAWFVGLCEECDWPGTGVIFNTSNGGDIWQAQAYGSEIPSLLGISVVDAGYCYPDK